MRKSVVVLEKPGVFKRVILTLGRGTLIHLHKLLISNNIEAGYRAVVRSDTDQSIKIDNDLIVAVRALKRDCTIGEIVDETGKDLEVIIEVVSSLIDNNFVARINNLELADFSDKIRPWFPKTKLTFLSGVTRLETMLVFGAISICVVFFGVLYTGLFPSYAINFWHEDLFVSFASAAIVGLVLAFLHEFAHLITTYAVGAKGRINFVKHRSIFWVYETESYHLALKTKSQRLAVYISGMIVDLLVLALVYVCLSIMKYYSIENGIVQSICLLVVFIDLIGLFWQLNIYVKTDMYNVMAELVGMDNLYEDMRWYLARQLRSSRTLLAKLSYKILTVFFDVKEIRYASDRLSDISRRDLNIIRKYTYFVLIGTIASIVVFAVYALRRDFDFLFQSYTAIGESISSANWLQLSKEIGIVFIILEYYVFILLSYYFAYNSGKVHGWILTNKRKR